MTTPAPHARRRRGTAMAVLLTASFMSLLDTTIVNVALGSIHEGLGAGEAALEWVVSGYALAFGLILIPAGRIGDRFGYKYIFCTGLVIFSLCSLACGLSQSPSQLVAFRVLQGLGAGIFSPAVSASIQHMYSGPARAKAFGILGTVIGISTASGPIIGGLIIQAFGDVHGWRWVFLVNVPIGIVAVIAGITLLSKAGSGGRHGMDPVGTVLVAAGLFALLLPLVEGQSTGWPVWTWICLACSPVLLAAFVAWEWRMARRGGEPLVDPRLMSIRSFSAGVSIALAYFAAFSSVFFVLSLMWQGGLGRSAIETGLMIIPWSIGSLITASQTSRLVSFLGRNTLLIGCGLVALGLIGAIAVIHFEGSEVTNWQMLAPLLIGGLGNGMFISPNQTFVLAEVPPVFAGSAGGVLQTFQRVGSAGGVAVVGTVFFALISGVPGTPSATQSYVHASQIALAVNVAFALIALVLVFALRDVARVRHDDLGQKFDN